jgi:transcriptional regulator with XRE-family HTH domain
VGQVTAEFAEHLHQLRNSCGLSVRQLAALAHCGKSHIHDLETGRRRPTPAIAHALDDALHAGGRLTATLHTPEPADDGSAEIEAIELARRVTAFDVSNETLDRLENAADSMATAYATVPPEQLLPRVSRHLGYVTTLVGARKTLAQHRRLLVVGGWFALLRATLHIDLRHTAAADAYLVAARQLADQAEHPEIAAWCLETKAWDVLTSGDFRRALQLSQHAQAIAPTGSSVLLQATAQEGRAWARLGDRTPPAGSWIASNAWRDRGRRRNIPSITTSTTRRRHARTRPPRWPGPVTRPPRRWPGR